MWAEAAGLLSLKIPSRAAQPSGTSTRGSNAVRSLRDAPNLAIIRPPLDDVPLALGLPAPGGGTVYVVPDSDFMASDAYEGRRSRSSHFHVEAARATEITTRLE